MTNGSRTQLIGASALATLLLIGVILMSGGEPTDRELTPARRAIGIRPEAVATRTSAASAAEPMPHAARAPRVQPALAAPGRDGRPTASGLPRDRTGLLNTIRDSRRSLTLRRAIFALVNGRHRVDPEAIDALLAVLERATDTETRRMAIWALSTSAHGALVTPHMVGLLGTPELAVQLRLEAIKALGQLATPEAIRALRAAAVEEPLPGVRQRAIAVLSMRTASSPATVRTLGRIGARDASAMVRTGAIDGLAALGSTAAREALGQLARTAPTEGERAHATYQLKTAELMARAQAGGPDGDAAQRALQTWLAAPRSQQVTVFKSSH